MRTIETINATDAPLRVRISEAAALAMITALPAGVGVAHPAPLAPETGELDGIGVSRIDRALCRPGQVGLSRLLEAAALNAVLTAKARGVGVRVRYCDAEAAWILSVPPPPMVARIAA